MAPGHEHGETALQADEGVDDAGEVDLRRWGSGSFLAVQNHLSVHFRTQLVSAVEVIYLICRVQTPETRKKYAIFSAKQLLNYLCSVTPRNANDFFSSVSHHVLITTVHFHQQQCRILILTIRIHIGKCVIAASAVIFCWILNVS